VCGAESLTDTSSLAVVASSGHIPLEYYKDPAKTAATFVTYDGVRYSLPGDLARIEGDGSVTLPGRGSNSINSGGEKVFPEEVEGALKAHGDVFDVLVVGVEVVEGIRRSPAGKPDYPWARKVTQTVAPTDTQGQFVAGTAGPATLDTGGSR
jgi:acyl-CoA synthetase (AMP-forming)/AMP-acid ligase II